MSEIESGHDITQALIDKVVGGVGELNASDTGDTVPETDTKGPLRDPESGQFVSRSEEVTDPEEGDETEATETETDEPAANAEDTSDDEDSDVDDDMVFELDPDHPFFAKYEGDPDKALKALEEAQSLIGRRNEEHDRLREEFEALKQQVTAEPAPPPVNWPAAIEFASEQDNPSEAFAYLANLAYENADEFGMRQVYEEWKAEDPGNALEWRQNLMIEYLAAQQQPAPPAEGHPAEAVEREVAEVIKRHPDLEQHIEAIGALAKERPVLGKALREGSPTEQAQALEDLYVLVRSRGDNPDTSTAAKKIALRARADADRAKADAAVVSASKTSATTPSSEDGVNEFKRLFREATRQPEQG